MDRPQAERQGLDWDVRQGRAYSALAESDGFRHFCGQLHLMRDEAMRVLVEGAGDEDRARGTIRLIDALLSVPPLMIEEGNSSEKELKRVAAERDE